MNNYDKENAMHIPARNTHTGTIMYWVDADTARKALAEGPAAVARAKRAQRHFRGSAEAARRDKARVARIYAEADRKARRPAYRSGVKHLIDNECDLIGAVAVPAAVSDYESIMSEAHRIEDCYVDDGDACLFSTIDEAIEYYDSQVNVSLRGAAYTYTLISAWDGREIEDDSGYVLEDGRRYATSREAELADAQPERDARAAEIRAERAAIQAEQIECGIADESGNINRGTVFTLPIGTVELTGRVSGRMVEVRFPAAPRRLPQFIGLSWFRR